MLCVIICYKLSLKPFPLSLAAIICIVLLISTDPCFSLLQCSYFFMHFVTDAVTVISLYCMCHVFSLLLLFMDASYFCHLEYPAGSGLFTFLVFLLHWSLQWIFMVHYSSFS